MMDKLEELAARVEAATWPQHDRVLNREVALAVGWCRRTPSQGRTKHPTWFHPDDCRNGEPVLDSLRGTDVWREPLDYLGSLDAAMTLVPIGSAAIHIGIFPEGAHCKIFMDEDGDATSTGNSKTPAIALTAATLRATHVLK